MVGSQPRGELSRYDAKSGQFVPYLSGISANGVDFSRDGQWVTYVATPEGTLWRNKVDGSERLRLTFPPLAAWLPRWSPDGEQIAFQALTPQKGWNMCLVSREGGSIQQLMPGQGTSAGRQMETRYFSLIHRPHGNLGPLLRPAWPSISWI